MNKIDDVEDVTVGAIARACSCCPARPPKGVSGLLSDHIGPTALPGAVKSAAEPGDTLGVLVTGNLSADVRTKRSRY